MKYNNLEGLQKKGGTEGNAASVPFPVTKGKSDSGFLLD
jgi:hypothetical protein